jgi:glutamine amidotransferase
MKQKIAIIDYGVGNVYSVYNSIFKLGYKVSISSTEEAIKTADFLILPGVGAFETAMNNLKAKKLDAMLTEEVVYKKKPLLGICVGMQMLSTVSEENGEHEGLNWIEGRVKKLSLPKGFSVPHVGWNDVHLAQKVPLFEKYVNQPHFYFDHSYHFRCDAKYIAATCDYGMAVIAAVQKDNIFGVQFHPEKSQTTGLKLFRSFFNQ